MTSPSFNHWMVGVGVPLARQTSWMLSFRRTPISLGSSDPEILGGTKREYAYSSWMTHEAWEDYVATFREVSLETMCFCIATFFSSDYALCTYLVWWGGSSCVPCPPHWRPHTCKCRCQKVVTVQSAACFLLRRCASPETLSSLKKYEGHMFGINYMIMTNLLYHLPHPHLCFFTLCKLVKKQM